MKSLLIRTWACALAGLLLASPCLAQVKPTSPGSAHVPAALKPALTAALASDASSPSSHAMPLADWSEQQVTAADGAGADEFGFSVALGKDIAVIGADKANGPGGAQGAAYVFTRSGATWSRAAKLVAADGAAGDGFGWSVALAGNRVLVGARGSQSQRGAAYVFEGSGASWTQTARLVAADGAAEDRFGTVVALSGDTALIAAATATVGGNAMQGAGYIFRLQGGTWSEVAKLVADDGIANQQLGIGAALDGSTAVLGTPSPFPFTGSAYIFKEAGGAWSQAQKLNGPGPFSGYGAAIALQGSHLLVGANLAMQSGAAYLYTETGGTWGAPVELLPAGGEGGDNFGYAVALDGDTAIIGADHSGGTGAAFLFQQTGGQWTQVDRVTASSGLIGDAGYGMAVAGHGDTLLVGAHKMIPGAAWFHQRLAEGGEPVASVTPAGLGFSAAEGSSDAGTLHIGNTGTALLNYAIDTAPAARAAMPSSQRSANVRRATLAETRRSGHWNSALRAGAGRFGVPVPLAEQDISQMADNSPGDQGVACTADDKPATLDNSWWRRFYFNEYPAVGAAAGVTSVTLSTSSQPLAGGLASTINLYTVPHSTPVDTIPIGALTLIGTTTTTLEGTLASVTIPVTGTIPDTAGLDLVVEWHTEGSGAGEFYPGANATAESHPTFLSSSACELDAPLRAADIGFPDFHLTMVVTLDEAPAGEACSSQAAVPWLSINPASGSVSPQQSREIEVIASAASLAAGEYRADLCVHTDDPLQPLIAVPVSFTVAADEAIFCSDFEAGESGSCGGGDLAGGIIDELVAADDNGSTLDLVRGLWSSYDFSRIDDINFYDSGDGSLTAYFYGDVVSAPVGAVVDAEGRIAVLAPGALVGPASPISAGSGVMPNWFGDVDGYIGLAFWNEAEGRINYGYIHLVTSGALGFPARVLEYAYDRSGAALVIPQP